MMLSLISMALLINQHLQEFGLQAYRIFHKMFIEKKFYSFPHATRHKTFYKSNICTYSPSCLQGPLCLYVSV